MEPASEEDGTLMRQDKQEPDYGECPVGRPSRGLDSLPNAKRNSWMVSSKRVTESK